MRAPRAEPTVVPGPAISCACARTSRGPSSSRAPAASGRRAIASTTPSTSLGDCTPVRLRAVVFLAGSDGAPELEPVDQPEAIRDLWALSFRLPTEKDAGRSFAGVADLASAVPAFRLRRSLALDALDDHVAKVLDGV